MHKRVHTLGVFLFTLLFSINTFAVPAKQLWARWTANNPQSHQKIDHREWQVFLDKYLYKGPNDLNVVAYGIVTAADMKALEDYVHKLEDTPVSEYNRDEQLAYWINLYNAATVNLILRYYPINSILDLDLSNNLFGQGPWDKKMLKVEGIPLSLGDIYRRILGPIWNDPRLHYAISIAAVGAPNIPSHVFTAENAWDLMDKGASDYINTRGLKIQHGRLYTSKVYQWYRGEFGGSDRALLAHFRYYATPELRQKLQNIHRLGPTYFDWKLNG